MSIIKFNHIQHAHCESGVTANLLNHHNICISEPMVFGIGSGIFFAHLPFVRVQGTPATTYRTWPGTIFKKLTKRLGIRYQAYSFSNHQKAFDKLDEVLAQGTPVGMLSSVFYLTYMPEAYRFHFNAHNLLVYGKEHDNYLVSDPVLEKVSTISRKDLEKARFAKGFPEPKGYMYYVTDTPEVLTLDKAIEQGIKDTCFFMLSPPVPWFGNKAINLLARKIEAYPAKYTPRKAALYLGNVIRMQEEIGTGGGGFRYLYAAFLQEAAQHLQKEALGKFAEEFAAIADKWRYFAFETARIVKDRNGNTVSYKELSKLLLDIGLSEKQFFEQLRKLKW